MFYSTSATFPYVSHTMDTMYTSIFHGTTAKFPYVSHTRSETSRAMYKFYMRYTSI